MIQICNLYVVGPYIYNLLGEPRVDVIEIYNPYAAGTVYIVLNPVKCY